MINLDSEFYYDPYPTGVIKNTFSPDIFDDLSDSFPPIKLFKKMDNLGSKYSLSEINKSGTKSFSDLEAKIESCKSSRSVINVLNSKIKKNIVNWSKF